MLTLQVTKAMETSGTVCHKVEDFCPGSLEDRIVFAKHASERDCDPKYIIYKIASPSPSDLRPGSGAA